MKKLMIVVSVLATAFSLSASNAKWGFNNEDSYYNKSGEEMNAGTAFIFLGTVTASESAFDLSKATFVTTAGYEDDYFGSVSTMVDLNGTSATAKEAFSLILFETENMKLADLANFEGNYVLYTGESELRVEPGASPIPFGEYYRNGEVYADAWSTMSAVPEPTSGLLLLLGVAGLALRRRRA